MEIKNNKYIYLKELSIQNIRSFGKKTKISLISKNGKPAMWNVIIGENGIGKTTILKAISLLLLNDPKNRKWRKYVDFEDLSRYNCPNNEIIFKANLQSNDNSSESIDIKMSVKNEDVVGVGNDEFFNRNYLTLFAYGASRTMGKELNYEKQDFPAISLFDDDASLLNVKDWLVKAEYISLKEGLQSQYEKVKEIIKSLFKSEVKDIRIDSDSSTYNDEVIFITDFGEVDISHLSLGYKSLIAWMADFAKGLFLKYNESENPLAMPAICLIDEIDLHIHPSLQREMVSFLSKTFPKTQFIVTAHSPLILQSAPDANIILLKKEKDSVSVELSLEYIKNWRLDQIFTSDLFGLESAHNEETEKLFTERKNLLLKEKKNPKEVKRLEEIEAQLEDIPILESKDALEAIELIKKASKNSNL